MIGIKNQCQYLHKERPGEFGDLKRIYRLLISFPFHTVIVESGFSHMNHIKDSFRNRLKPENLNNLLTICLYPNFVINYSELASKLVDTWKYASR